MKIHMVGGFLGSGKTTAISRAAKILVNQKKKVGIITNDQGKHLVDTAFFRAQNLPAMEVTGGCFCCHFNDLGDQIEKIANEYDPDVIFAESVGSCADIVATVVKPLQELRSDLGELSSYSVFTDARLLERYLYDLEMPFREDVTYIFSKQIEEASILIINKIDLLDEKRVEDLTESARKRYPNASILLQNSFDELNVAKWVEYIHEDSIVDDLPSLDIDYDRYARGEQTMAWLDKHLLVKINNDEDKNVLAEMIFTVAKEIDKEKSIAGHVKFNLQSNNKNTKISAPTMQSIDQEFKQLITTELLDIDSGCADLWINALVVGSAEILEKIVLQTMKTYKQTKGLDVHELEGFSRTPGYPKPTHRIE